MITQARVENLKRLGGIDWISALRSSQVKKLVESGAFHLTQVKLENQLWLRTTIMNPLTVNASLKVHHDVSAKVHQFKTYS